MRALLTARRRRKIKREKYNDLTPMLYVKQSFSQYLKRGKEVWRQR